MTNKIKKILAMVLAVIMSITVLPQSVVNIYAATGTASLSNIGQLGKVNIGSKSESGTWLKTMVNGKAVFCLDLGKACHTGDVYVSESGEISSDSSNAKTATEAKAGYWFTYKMKKSNKAWVYAQCLIWSAEEGRTSESQLKDVIKQVRNNTGYYSDKSVDGIYKDIFDVDHVVTCEITKWTSSAYARQVLLEINSTDIVEDYKYYPLNEKCRYRQRITLKKTDEDGKALPKVKFSLVAKNVKELYSFKFNGWGEAEGDEVDEDQSRFEIEALTDSSGKITYKFDYQIQSEDYYYCKSDDLKDMSATTMKELKAELSDEGYKYASDLSKAGAEKLIEKDLKKQMEDINNKYVVKELDAGNENIIATGSIAEGMTITIKSDKSWTKVDGVWLDNANGKGDYEKAYQLEVTNKYKKVKLTAVKLDEETGKAAQGDATLAGAVYGMYEDKACTKLMKQYTTDKNGQFETDYVRCGSDYYLKEITPPTGYLKNDKVYTIHEDGQEYTAEYNNAKSKVELGETVIKGNVAITKIMTNGAVGITKSEADAEFQIYLAGAGSYDKAKAAERDVLITNEDGYAKSKDLPYGTYIVHQVKGADETEYVSDFYVDVKENGETYKYILNNPSFMAYLKVVKKDAQTKQTVLKAGTTYQIFSLDEKGNETVVKQSFSNGNRMETVDKFVTDESGEIITYEPLKAGTYRIREVQGPEGTYNNGKPVDIVITNKSYKTAMDDAGNEYKYAECIYYNNETYGRFTVEKTGPSAAGFEEENSPVSEISTITNPLAAIVGNTAGNLFNNRMFTYEDIYLDGVVFELYAKEDIVTQDNQGTNWFEEGEKVATITTGEGAEFTKSCEGICSHTVDEETGNVTLNIPLGKYEIREVSTLYGYVLPETNAWDLEFQWNSQTEEYVYDISGNTENGVLKVKNDFPQTDISIVKKDSVSEKAVPGTVFGFYSKDNIYDRNGKVIVEAGEKLATVITDDEGIATVPFSVPVMSEGYASDTVQTEEDTETEVNAGLNSGDYYFVEESISDSYFLDETPIYVHVEYENQETKVIKAEAVKTNTQTVTEIDKMMIASSVEIPDCHLTVKDKAGNEIVSWVSGNVDSVVITDKAEELGYQNLSTAMDENGNIIVNGLLHDMEYTLTETKPADGYVTAADISFMLDKKVSEDGEVMTEIFIADEAGNYVDSGSNQVVMYDDTTKIEFSKTDITGEKEVPGCELEVTDKETGEVMDQWTSTKHKHVIEGKYVVGKTYVMTEKRPADGFVTASDVEFTVSDTGEVQGVSMKDDTTKIEFSKIASDTKKLLKGAKYGVYDSKGEKVYEFTTNKKKAVILDGVLKAGETYTFVEEKAPKNYKKAEDVKIKVKDIGKIQKIKVIDERIPEVPDTPQTGNNRNIILYALALLFGFGAITTYSCIRVNHGKKKEDEA